MRFDTRLQVYLPLLLGLSTLKLLAQMIDSLQELTSIVMPCPPQPGVPFIYDEVVKLKFALQLAGHYQTAKSAPDDNNLPKRQGR